MTPRPWQAALLLILAAVVPYLNTFAVPFYFDDINNIVDNPQVRDLPGALRGLFTQRGLAILTFAVNHRLGGLDPFGYHLINIAIHLGCTLAVWLLLRRVLEPESPWPLCGALLFALHPVQTQAVTYVVQRMTSLSALFFLLAVLSYLKFLEAPARRRPYWLAVGWGALAVLTKENAAVLPLVLLLVERYFHPGRSWRKQLTGLLPFCAVPAWKAAEILLLPLWQGEVAASIRYADQLQGMQNVTPLRYLFTEFSVLWYYVKLLLLPIGQRLDYGWPVVEQLLTVQNLAALLGLLALWLLAWHWRRHRPLASFGIAWFFLALAVESSVIPLDPIFEHRLYLPSVGFIMVGLDLLRGFAPSRLLAAGTGAVLLLLALLTWQRNALWNDRVAFFEDNLRLNQENVRVMVMLGNAYVEARRHEDGIRMLRQALERNPRYDFAYTALGKVYIDLGEGASAIPLLLQGVEIHPTSVVLNEYLGVAYGQTGDLRRAMTHLQRAAQLSPDDASVITNIGVLYSMMGDDRSAVDYFERSLLLVADSEKTLMNLAATLYALGENRRAFEMLQEAARSYPANADAQYGRGTLAPEFGRRQDTVEARDALRRLGDERAAELDRLLER